MTKSYDELDPKLADLLNRLRPTPGRDPRRAAQGRADFLAQAKSFRPAVSPAPGERHTWWIEVLHHTFRRKERSPMFATLITILMSVALLFGGFGATAVAAQGSLPDNLLYPIKILSEDTRLEITSRPQNQVRVLLEYANRRIDELDALIVSGKSVPAPVVNRYQAQVENAFQIVAGMSDSDIKLGLESIQANLQRQEQQMSRVRQRANQNADPAFEQIQAMIQERLKLVATGLIDPQAFRLQARQHFQGGQRTPGSTPVWPGSGGGAGPGPMNPSATPLQNGAGPGPGPMNPTTTSMPDGAGLGPGPMNPSATPQQDGTGPGPTNSNITPQPGGNGPGPGPANPSASPGQNGNGPGPGNPQPTWKPGGGGNGGGGHH